jgi:hypothetical protein
MINTSLGGTTAQLTASGFRSGDMLYVEAYKEAVAYRAKQHGTSSEGSGYSSSMPSDSESESDLMSIDDS